MFRETVCGLGVLLLFISMLPSAYNIPTIKSCFQIVSERGLSTNNSRLMEGNIDVSVNMDGVSIIGHRIETAELEELRQKIGVGKKGGNCNRIVQGYGTGLRPPTEEEWVEIKDKLVVIEDVSLNDIDGFPSSVDHTTKPWFPPIGNQGVEGSCVAWVVGYYMKTFQEAKEHGWNLSQAGWEAGRPSPVYQHRIFSPDFIYHLINGGVDGGSNLFDAINLVCGIGVSSWQEMPYDPVNSTRWPSEGAWREAPLYRGNSSFGVGELELETNKDLKNLKNWIAEDHLAAISVDGNQFSKLTGEDLWTLNNYRDPELNHAVTIVGYNDSIQYSEGGESRQGAFKIANSWGEGGWENIPDGCYWISYEAMKQRVGHCLVFRDVTGYQPELVSSFRMNHSRRGECDITIGMGNRGSPSMEKSFSGLIDGGDRPFCSNNIVFDITEFKDTVPPVNRSFFMKVYDQGVPPAHSGVYEWYSDGTSYSWFRLGRTFNIPEAGATLNFWSYYEMEEDWDYGYVEVHDLDEDEWYTLPGLNTSSKLPNQQDTDNPNCPYRFEPSYYYDAGRWNAFTGFSNGAYQEEMDLTPFANHTIQLYFTYWTDPYVLELGWYIDDIQISEVGFFDDVESGIGNWTYNGWNITTPEPPTTGTISSFSVEYYYHSYGSDSFYVKSTSHDIPVNTTDLHYTYAQLKLEKNISWNHYHNYTEIEDILLYLNATYPGILDVFPIGQSRQNRTIYCLRLTNESGTQPKPKVLFVGYHHSREPISAELPLYFAVEAAKNYKRNQTITQMLDLCEIYVVVALNPDGFHLFEMNDWQRKNARSVDDDEDGLVDEDPPEDIDGDGFTERLWNTTTETTVKWEGVDNDSDGEYGEDWVGGVDLNRNYGFKWNATVESGSTDPSSPVYKGPTPFSEPESQALRDLVLEHDFKYAVSFHSGAEMIISPWGYTEETPPDAEVFDEIGEELSAVIGCPYGRASGSLYTTSGSWVDWMYGNQNVIAFTCEIFKNDTEWFSEPGPTSDTIWQGGIRYAFNPRPQQIEKVIYRWMPLFTYIANRTINVLPTDLNQDGTVNMLDIAIVATAFGSAAVDDPETEKDETENWNEDADVNGDKIINIKDIATVAKDYGKTV